MAYCGTGTSHARPSSPAVSYLIGAAAVAVTVETLGLSAVWADLIAYAAGQTFTTATFCASDPPAMPVWGITDVADIIGGTPATGPVGWQKLADLIAIGAWLTFCECVAPAVVTLPTPPTYPAGAPVLTSPSIPTVTASPCIDKKTSYSIPLPTSAGHYIDLTTALYPAIGVPITVQPQTGFFINAYPIPAGANGLTITLTPSQIANYSGFKAYLWSDATHTVDLNRLNASPHPWTVNPLVLSMPTLPANANYISLHATDGYPNQVQNESFTAEFSLYCSGAAPGTPVQPCCPPDPTLMAQLQQIYKTVTLLQRYSVPFAYVNGPTHAGLSGNGVLTLPGCLGLRVDITTLPGRLGQEAGDPTEYFDVGWYSWGDASGFLSREFISHDPQLSFPPKAQQMTRWGYSLLPGVVASVTELYAEP